MTSIAVPAPRAASGGPSGPERLLGLVFWVVLPALSVLAVVLGLMTWTSHVDDKPAGIPGVYRVDAQTCTGSLCIPSGTFTSADGLQLELWGDPRWTLGSKHAVVYDPSSPAVVIALPSRWNPSATITALTGAAGLLAVWGWFAFGARRPHAGAPQLA